MNINNFDEFFHDKISPFLEKVEEKREKAATGLYIIMAVLIVIDLIIFAGTGFSMFTGIFIFIISIVVYLAAYNIITHKYLSSFSSDILNKLIKFIDESLSYSRSDHIAKQEYAQSKLYSTYYDGFSGSDLVYGKMGKTSIKFSHLYVYEETEDEDSDGHKTTHRTTIFKGIMFIADFNKSFNGEVFVLPHRFKLFKSSKSVMLEDPDFHKYFDVYGSDQIMSRYVLSTSLVKRILDYRENIDKDIRMSLIDSTLYVGIPGYDGLKIPVFSTILDKDLYKNYLYTLNVGPQIVDELNLNTRIWTKN